MCGEAENLSVYRVGKSLTSIWVFLYPKVDFIKNFLYNIYIRKIYAGIAQLVEQLTCNEQIGGSNPSTGSKRRVISLFERKQKTQELLTQITKIEEKYEDKIAS